MSSPSRRDFLRYGSLASLIAAGVPLSSLLSEGSAAAAALRHPGSRPYPHRPAGAVNTPCRSTTSSW